MTDFTNSISIGKAALADVPALVLLEQASFSTDKLDARNFRQLLQRGHSDLIVARHRGQEESRLAGYILVLYRANSTRARIYSIAVDMRCRGFGVGEKLLAAGERQARREKRSVMRLEVRPDNVAAIRMYEKHGYTRFGVFTGFYEDGTDALRLEKLL